MNSSPPSRVRVADLLGRKAVLGAHLETSLGTGAPEAAARGEKDDPGVKAEDETEVLRNGAHVARRKRDP